MNMIFFNFIEKRDFIEIVENLCSLDKINANLEIITMVNIFWAISFVNSY